MSVDLLLGWSRLLINLRSTADTADRAFQNKSVFRTLKGTRRYEGTQRQAERRSNHRRSGATKRPLPEGGSLSVEARRQLGKDIKGDDLFTSPSSDGSCVFESAQKRSRRKELGGGTAWLSRPREMERRHEHLLNRAAGTALTTSLWWLHGGRGPRDSASSSSITVGGMQASVWPGPLAECGAKSKWTAVVTESTGEEPADPSSQCSSRGHNFLPQDMAIHLCICKHYMRPCLCSFIHPSVCFLGSEDMGIEMKSLPPRRTDKERLNVGL